MKKIISAFFGICCVSMLLLSCSKGDYNSGSGLTGPNPYYEPPSGSATTGGSFKATINGSNFVASIASALKVSGGGLTVSGVTGTSPSNMTSVSFTISSPAVGEFTVGSGLSAQYTAMASSTIVIPTSGKVNITALSESNVKGTFELYASGLDIINGSFDVAITATP